MVTRAANRKTTEIDFNHNSNKTFINQSKTTQTHPLRDFSTYLHKPDFNKICLTDNHP